MVNALVTGANGFIGSNLCAELIRAGDNVSGLVRSSSDLGFLNGLDGLNVVTGNVTDLSSLRRAMHGISVVFHVAGYVSDWGPWETFRAVNVEGVRNVMKAALDAGVSRVVHLSSASVYGFPGKRHVTEDTPFIPLAGDPYAATKVDGERLALSYHGKGIEVTVIRPATVYGPNDRTTTVKLARALVAGGFGYVDRGRHIMAPLYIDNLTQLMRRAGGHPAAAGEAYNAVDDGLTSWRQFTEWLCADLGCPPPWLSLPRHVVWPIAVAVEGVAKALRRPHAPMITKYRIRAVQADNHYSAEKAKRQLGYRPTVETREGIRRTVEWYLGFRDMQRQAA